MTEKQWLATKSAQNALKALTNDPSQRKLRLFVCACWREYHRCWVADPTLYKSRSHMAKLLEAIEAGELMADGRTPPASIEGEKWYATEKDIERGARQTAQAVRRLLRTDPVAFLRDIFGNPFRPVVADPSWLTSTVVALAQGIYDERAYDRMPILADALQDAGCDNERVLSHCRDPQQVHVRGCWVVDLLLGKT